jgi:hypothetical protein
MGAKVGSLKGQQYFRYYNGVLSKRPPNINKHMVHLWYQNITGGTIRRKISK